MAYKVVTEQIPDDMLDGYRRVRFAGPGVRHALYTDEPFESRDPYTKPYPGLVSFIDMFPQPPWSTADVGYAFTSPEQRGQGHMRTLMQHVYDSYPDRPIRWGKIMDDHVQKLRDEYRQKMPDRTANDGYIAPNVATAYPLATQAFIDTVERLQGANVSIENLTNAGVTAAMSVLNRTYGLRAPWPWTHARLIGRIYETEGLDALKQIANTPPAPTEEFANEQWPDTLPWGDAEQDYYRNARIARMERLGASLEELAHETVESILGYQGKDGHKPPRADIQKYYDAAENWKEYRKALNAADSDRNVFYEDGPHKRVLDWWTDNMGLNEKEISAVSLYKHILNNRSGDFYNDPKAAFDWVARMWGGIRHFEKEHPGEEMVGVNSPDVFDNVPEEATEDGKKFVGAALKKYEKQHYPMLYECIKDFLDDMLRTGPADSYKLWPRGVQWIKEMFTDWLMKENGTFNRPNMSITGLMPRIQHIEDIVREGGQILAKLRAENRIPQGFDVNKVSFKDFEEWLMEWKRENLGSENAGEIVYEYKDGWTMQKLTTPEQLQYEGDEMGHCVGGYASAVGRGEDIIYSLRDPKGIPHVTIEVRAKDAWTKPNEDGEWKNEYVHPDKHQPGTHYDYKDNGWSRWGPDGEEGRKPDEHTPIDEHPFEVVQIQGNSNNTPKPEYQRKVKEFFDYLKSKGWKFNRADDWFAPFDERYNDDYDHIEHARHLDDWFDDHYKTDQASWTGTGEDVYGLGGQAKDVSVKDWEEVMTECAASLIDDYDRERMKTSDFAGLAQATWHLFMLKETREGIEEGRRKRIAKDFEEALQAAEEQVNNWVWQQQDYYHELNEFADEVEEKYVEMGGKWKDEEYDPKNENNWHDPYGNPFREPEDEELLDEARQEVISEWDDRYAGNAYKYFSYLHNLLYHIGIQTPSELPQAQDRHAGLPGYDDLIKKNEDAWQQAQTPEIPGALS